MNLNTFAELVELLEQARRQIDFLHGSVAYRTELIEPGIQTTNQVAKNISYFMVRLGPKPIPSSARSFGWLVENGKKGDNIRYRCWEYGPAWTADHNKALRFARREDAEVFSEDDEDAWCIVQHGWYTTPCFAMNTPMLHLPLDSPVDVDETKLERNLREEYEKTANGDEFRDTTDKFIAHDYFMHGWEAAVEKYQSQNADRYEVFMAANVAYINNTTLTPIQNELKIAFDGVGNKVMSLEDANEVIDKVLKKYKDVE